MDYSFSGTPVRVRPDHMTVFWGAAPHCVTNVIGSGQVINVYVSFSQVLHWGLPAPFIDRGKKLEKVSAPVPGAASPV